GRTRSKRPELVDRTGATAAPLPPAVHSDRIPKAQLELFDPSETGERGQVRPPKLPPYRGGHTTGSFYSPMVNLMMRKGYEGPASVMPKGSPGFAMMKLGHVAGHRAALMRHLPIRAG